MTTPFSTRQLRHELLNSLNQVLGFSEIVIEELVERGEAEQTTSLVEICKIVRGALINIDHELPARPATDLQSLSEDTINRLDACVRPCVARILDLNIEECSFAKTEPNSNDIQHILAATYSVSSLLEDAARQTLKRTH